MFKDGEQQVLDTYEDVLNELKENINKDDKRSGWSLSG